MKLEWDEDFDDQDNTTHEAASCFHDDGCPFHWRIKPVLRRDSVVWVLAADAELMLDGFEDEEFDSIEAAKSFCQEQNDEAIKTLLPPEAD